LGYGHRGQEARVRNAQGQAPRRRASARCHLALFYVLSFAGWGTGKSKIVSGATDSKGLTRFALGSFQVRFWDPDAV